MMITVLCVAMQIAIWGLINYIRGERRHQEGYAMGRDAARIKDLAIAVSRSRVARILPRVRKYFIFTMSA